MFAGFSLQFISPVGRYEWLRPGSLVEACTTFYTVSGEIVRHVKQYNASVFMSVRYF